jgi:hypothetical protein
MIHAQPKTDSWLASLLQKKGSPFLKDILAKPDIFRYQLIYTQINRDEKNNPTFSHSYLNVDKEKYFNPASTVKMPLAFLALEKISQLKKFGVNMYSSMLTDSTFSSQTAVTEDSSAENGLPSVAHYIKKVFLVSDNDAYNRLYEFTGQQTINERLWQMGYTDMRITRRFTRMTEEENRHMNAIRFVQDNQLLYAQPSAYSNIQFDFSKTYLLGKAHYNRDEKLIQSPMDFTTHNKASLQNLQRMLQAVLFPSSVKPLERFKLNNEDYAFLYQYMSQLPSESTFPRYDTSKFFDSYTKFFFFRAGKDKIPDHIRSFNKTGWAYGFLTDVCYIVDFKNKVEFMLSGNIYVNSDGILNDDKYEYEETGYPFFKEVGKIIYELELQRKREYPPDLNQFRIKYE